ncbi:NADH-quinone oxidoreductase subunit J [Luteitalea sp. TBR-22]|uniref:NADH-quinone oxidoreductase subunit J family protein n=1 Tax=Luteitalea sp. TBR-22 TaxID=2802971 RepID=UPI001AF8E7E8|nr:NADH-quinone oxidoreductase subunit J [Luteitalea sp. TBR-22]BCS34664.1 NADH-quinone oxidoreductase subunit J [Luteitalea sp. TBR-22]
MAPWLFYLFAAISLICSLGVIGQRNPMYSVLLLIGSFISLAGLYVGLDSPFVAVTQIVVYAGAIMVLFLFVVMLLNAPREDVAPGAQLPIPGGVKAFGAVLALGMGTMLVWALSRLGAVPFVNDPQAAARVASVRDIGVMLFRDHAFAFEVTSILILVAMVGAVVLAKKTV